MLTTSENGLKHSTYDPKTNQVLEEGGLHANVPHSVIDAASTRTDISDSEVTYNAALRQVVRNMSVAEEVLVTKLSIAITMMPPSMPEERVHHALFTKQMYLAGEIDFENYVNKMRNLFPERMEALPQELRAEIEAALKELS